MRKGDSITIDAATRKVTHVNGAPVKEHTPEFDALVEEFLGPAIAAAPQRVGKPKNLEADI